MPHCKADEIEWSGDVVCWLCGAMGDAGPFSDPVMGGGGPLSWTLGAGKQTFGYGAGLAGAPRRAAPRVQSRL